MADYTKLYRGAVHCQLIASFCPDYLSSLCRTKPWWDPCSCLKTWCRTRREDGDMENKRAWCECVVRVDAYVQYVQSLLLLLPSYPAVGCDPARMPHDDLKEGTGRERFELSYREFFPHTIQSDGWDRLGHKRHHSESHLEDCSIKEKDAPTLQSCSQPAKS